MKLDLTDYCIQYFRLIAVIFLALALTANILNSDISRLLTGVEEVRHPEWKFFLENLLHISALLNIASFLYFFFQIETAKNTLYFVNLINNLFYSAAAIYVYDIPDPYDFLNIRTERIVFNISCIILYCILLFTKKYLLERRADNEY